MANAGLQSIGEDNGYLVSVVCILVNIDVGSWRALSGNIMPSFSTGSPDWAKSFGGSGSEFGNGIAVDASGNSYTTGYFQGSMTVGNTTLTAVGNYDMFVIKLDASGSPLWAKSFGGSGFGRGNGIGVDAAGNSYTTGFFEGSMTVGNTTLTAVGNYDMFVIKLDASGSPLWAKSFGGSGFDYG